MSSSRTFGLFAPRLADGQHIDVDGLTLRLRVNPRSRRVSVRIDAVSGEAVASAPSARRLADALAFARSRRDWLAGRLERRAAAPSLQHGETISLFGAPYRLVADGRRPRLADGLLRGCGENAVDAQLAARCVRRLALENYRSRAEIHCARLGVKTPTVSLSDPRSRWGSCVVARDGSGWIRISWRLALAPFAVADYVVAHECAHLLEGNHGPKFWAHVRDLIGDPAPHRAWLRREGPALHGFARR